MRLAASVFLLLACCGAAADARAQAQSQGLIVGAFGCPQTIPCNENDPKFPSSAQLAATAASCLARRMSTVAGVTPFDEIAGLDGDGCLTTNPQAFAPTGKVTDIPQCCIRQIAANSCGFSCEIVAQ